MAERTPLLPLLRIYVERDATVAAQALEAMTVPDAQEAVSLLPPSVAARIVPHLQVSYAAALMQTATPELIKAVLKKIDAKRVASLLAQLSDEDRQRIVPHLTDQLRFELKEQLDYPEDSIGRIMTRQFLSFHQDAKVREVTRKLRILAKKQPPASYVYVVSDADRLVGVLNMYGLLLAPPEQPIRDLMRGEVFAMDGFTSQEEAAAELARRKYFALPVVDGQGHMLGIVRGQDLMQGLQQEVGEDLLKMVGVDSDERPFSSMSFSMRKRLPWLHINLVTAFMAASVIALFEGLIAQITVLAVFLPVVAGQGGNAGAQSLAIVMRGLVMREIPPHRRKKLVVKETILGAINGAVTGLVTAIIAWLWYGNPMLGLVVGLGMIVNLLFAGMAGASIPLIMKSLRLDPAQCATIILTTVTDMIGFLAFLGFALLFRNQLM